RRLVAYRDARDLQFQIALIAPEPRYLLIGRRPAGETVGDTASLVYRVLHRFEAHATGREGGREISAIANGGDRRVARHEVFVDDYAVIDSEPSVAGQLGIRDNADANQGQIGGDMPSIGRLDSGHRSAGAENSDHSGAERDVGSPANMRFGKEPRH